MEPPFKRRRLGLDDPDEQLHYRKTLNDSRLKASFESIFEKYSKDFSEVGDEIDLETGEIVVNNGHLLSMRNEQDIDGGGNDMDELYALDSSSRHREPGVSNADQLSISPELTAPSLIYDHNEPENRDDDVDSLMGDIGHLDNALAVANPFGATEIGILSLADRSILSSPPSGGYVNGPTTSQSSVQHRTAHQQSVYVDSRDLATDPKWIVPPLPNLQTLRTPQPSQDQLQILRDCTERSASPPGDSLWATPETQSLQKRSRKKWLREEDALLRHLKLSTNLTYREMQPRFPGRAWNALRKRWSSINPVKESSVYWSKEEDKLLRHMKTSTNFSLSEILERLPGRSKFEIEHRWSNIQGLAVENEIPDGDRGGSLTSKKDHMIQSKTSQQTRTLKYHLPKTANFSAQAYEALPTPTSQLGEAFLRDNQLSVPQVQELPNKDQIPQAEVQQSPAEVQILAYEPFPTPLGVTKAIETLTNTPTSHLGRRSRTLSVVIERFNHSPVIAETISLPKSNHQQSQLQRAQESVDERDSLTSPCSQNNVRRNPSHLGPLIVPDGLCMFPPQLTSARPITSYTIEHRKDPSDSTQAQPDTLPERSTPLAEDSTCLPIDSTPLPEEPTPLPEESFPLPEDSTSLPKESTPVSGVSTPLAPSPDSHAQELGKVPASTDPEIPPVVHDEYQEPLQAGSPPQLTSDCSTSIPLRPALQRKTPPPESAHNPQSLSSEVVQGSLEPSRDELDFISILSSPAQYPRNTAGSSARPNSTSRKRKIRSSSIAVTSFGSMLGDLSDDELSFPSVTYPKTLSAEKVKVMSPNRQCGSAGFRCDRKVCLRCT